MSDEKITPMGRIDGSEDDPPITSADPAIASDPVVIETDTGLTPSTDASDRAIDPKVDASEDRLAPSDVEAGGLTDRDTQDDYSGAESVTEMKCIRLTEKIKTLNKIMSIRKDLLDVREREAKELVAKLNIFEEIIRTEREARTQLRERIRSAEQQCIDLIVQVQENARARREYETNLVNLSMELAQSRRSGQEKSEANTALEARIQELELQLEKKTTNEARSELAGEIQTEAGKGDVVSEMQNPRTVTDPDSNEAAVPEEISDSLAESAANLDSDAQVESSENPATEAVSTGAGNSDSNAANLAAEDTCVLSIRDLREKLKLVMQKNRELTHQLSLLNTPATTSQDASVTSFISAEKPIIEPVANLPDNSNSETATKLVEVTACEPEAVSANSMPDPNAEPVPDSIGNPDSETASTSTENSSSKSDDARIINIREMREKLRRVLEQNRVLTYQMSLLNTLFMETEGTPIDFTRIKAIGDIVRESQNATAGASSAPQEPEEPLESELGQDRERRQLDVTRIMNKLDDLEGSVVPIPGEESCYMSVDTGGGPKLVLSVSRTFIKLKDLILEKKYLRQEIDGLKELNAKLEGKVDTQEKRLYRVALELNKTWSLVSKLKAQHSQLHNSEAVLRYELHEKRKLLEKLKYDLKTSRDKWAKVRKQNSESQIEWQSIRDEFTRRRLEACPSRESAFFSEPVSSLSNDAEIEIETEAGESPEKAEEPVLSEEEGARSSGAEAEEVEDPLLVHDEFVEDLVEEIDDIVAATEDVDEEVVQIDGSTASWEELVNKRALRLRLLEEQCRHLYNKVQASTARNAGLAAKLAHLHNHYGSETSPDDEPVAGCSKDSNGTDISNGCGSSTNTAYASACIGQTDEDATEVQSSDNDEFGSVLEPAEVMQTPKSRRGHGPLTQSESDLNARITSEDRRRVSVPATTTTQELLAELRSVLVLDEEENNTMTPAPSSEIRSLYAAPLRDTPGCLEDEDDAESRSSPAGDLNALSRILIQQLPKRLEVLKEENQILRQRLSAQEASSVSQSVAACSSGSGDVAAAGGAAGGSGVESGNNSGEGLMELRNELELKQKVIEELTSKIQVATENYETINREHGRMAEYFKMKMQERMIQEQRKIAKSQNVKNCSHCEKRFTLFKRKHNCSVCGHSFCMDCLVEQPGELGTHTNLRKQKKIRTCNSCTQRRRLLEAAVIESVE